MSKKISEEKSSYLGREPISKLLLKQALPLEKPNIEI